jgi:hypothetical protein
VLKIKKVRVCFLSFLFILFAYLFHDGVHLAWMGG